MSRREGLGRHRALGAHLCLIHIGHYYTAYWQAWRGEAAKLDVPPDFPATFPREGVVLSLAAALTGSVDRGEAPTFALVMTDYFGGASDQWACAFLSGPQKIRTLIHRSQLSA